MAPPTVSRSDFKHYKRVLIKVGTSVVTHTDGRIALPRIAFIVEQVQRLVCRGVEVILISSGSVGVGKQKLGHTDPAFASKQYEQNHIFMRSYAATGQSGLMGIYEYMFSYYGVKCAQVLVTDEDFHFAERRKNLKSTLNTLLSYKVVPVLNENDVISTRKEALRDNEMKILWDNDSLACLVGIELKVDLILLLTDVDGLYKRLPINGHGGGEVIDIYNPTQEQDIVIGAKSRVGRGGMEEKKKNALNAVAHGVKAVVIASGKKQYSIDAVINGESVGTLFVDKKSLTKIQQNPSEIAVNARMESRKLQQLSTNQRTQILLEISDCLKQNVQSILDANKLDLENAQKTNLNKQLLNRLKLDAKKLNVVITGIAQIARYEEPIGHVVRDMDLSSTLNLKQITCPIGVLLVIFESRPDVLPQVIALSIKSGNGLLLKGGSEALHTNKMLYKLIAASISKTTGNKIDGKKIISLIETRKDIKSLLSLDGDKIDLIIPRGSMQFVQYIQENTSIPVLGHSSGLCHTYIDEYADLQKAVKILVDAKTNYPSACNATETLLVHQRFAEKYLAKIVQVLQEHNVEIFVSENAKHRCKNSGILEKFPICKSFREEFGDLEINVEIVDDILGAVNHINKYGSGHTDSIVTENAEHQRLFLNLVDSACVFSNASTRFADGYRFGLGAEVGISTNRIHARGPVGIRGLLTTKWLLRSVDKQGDAVTDYQSGKKKYIFKSIKSKM